MRFATEDDFIDVYDLFKKNRELLPHIRMGHIARKIEERRKMKNPQMEIHNSMNLIHINDKRVN